MIVLSGRFFGAALFTWHIKLGIDLPPADFKKSFGPIEIELTLGPRTVAAPAHSTEMVQVQASDVQHEAPDPRVDSFA